MAMIPQQQQENSETEEQAEREISSSEQVPIYSRALWSFCRCFSMPSADGIAAVASLLRNDNFNGVIHSGVGDYFSERKNDL
jgi:hypothetical protein